jgi:hypothetical protein
VVATAAGGPPCTSANAATTLVPTGNGASTPVRPGGQSWSPPSPGQRRRDDQHRGEDQLQQQRHRRILPEPPTAPGADVRVGLLRVGVVMMPESSAPRP